MKIAIAFILFFIGYVMNVNGKSKIAVELVNFDKDIKVEKVTRDDIPVKEFYGIPFEIESLDLKNNIISVTAKIKNSDTSNKEIFSYGSSPLIISVNIPRKVTSPSLPQVPPALVKWSFPSMCEVLLTASLDLSNYEYKGSPEIEVTALLRLRQEYVTKETRRIKLDKN